MKYINNFVINLENVSKEYVIHHEKPTLVEKFVKSASFKKDEKFLALKNVNLSICKGEKIGLIGPNGSGKTTLLKIISGITYPTLGKIETKGKIVSLIDLEAGFHPDLSGYQNIFLNGMILNMTKTEINDKLNDIIKFAGIGKFIDAPLFTYSTGMVLRLGFSIAIHSNPDILLLDELISVADSSFQQKTENRLNYLSEDCTLIFSSHYKEFIDTFCKRVITLDKGKIIEDADINKCKKYYKNL